MSKLRFIESEKIELITSHISCPFCNIKMKRIAKTSRWKEYLYKCPRCNFPFLYSPFKKYKSFLSKIERWIEKSKIENFSKFT